MVNDVSLSGDGGGCIPMTLKVAEDAKPGQQVWFTSPHGQQMQTVIPEGKVAGDEFTVFVPVPQTQQVKVKVVVPEGVKPGETIIFQGPFGYDMQAIVPEGSTSGDTFYVYATAPPPQPQLPSNYTLTVPDDKKAGDELVFGIADGQQMMVIVPEGKGTGDTLQVQIGPSQVNVPVPEGKMEGDEMEFVGPGGVLMKATIPKGKKPGEQFVASLIDDPNLKKGLPALCAAAANGDLEGAKSLVSEAEVSLNATYENGFTPLFYAASSGELEVAKWLLQAKADVNASNDSKRTSLHWAARNGHDKVVELLLNAKADLHLEDALGRNPLTLALGYNRYETAEVLRKAAAKLTEDNPSRQ